MKKQFKILTILLVLALAFLLTGCSTNYEKTYALDKEVKGTELTQEEYDEIEKKVEEAKENIDYNKVTVTVSLTENETEHKSVTAIDSSSDNVKAEISTYTNGELTSTTWIKEGIIYTKDVEENTKTYCDEGTTFTNSEYNINTFIKALNGLANVVNNVSISVSADGVEIVKDNKGNIVVTIDKSDLLLGGFKSRMVFENNMLVFFTHKTSYEETTLIFNFGKAKISYPNFNSYEEE